MGWPLTRPLAPVERARVRVRLVDACGQVRPGFRIPGNGTSDRPRAESSRARRSSYCPGLRDQRHRDPAGPGWRKSGRAKVEGGRQGSPAPHRRSRWMWRGPDTPVQVSRKLEIRGWL